MFNVEYNVENKTPSLKAIIVALQTYTNCGEEVAVTFTHNEAKSPIVISVLPQKQILSSEILKKIFKKANFPICGNI